MRINANSCIDLNSKNVCVVGNVCTAVNVGVVNVAFVVNVCIADVIFDFS